MPANLTTSHLLKHEIKPYVRMLVPAAYARHQNRFEYIHGERLARYGFKPGVLISLLLHIALLAVFAWFAKQTPLPKLEEVPITVSLLSEIAEAPIVDQQSVLEAKPVVEHKLTKPNAVKQTIQEKRIEPSPQAITEAPYIEAVSQASTAETTEQASVYESKPTETTAKATVEKAAPKEEITEPPKFGVAYLNNPKPKYPRLSKSAGEEGRVLFKVLVNESGDPETIEVISSSGFERLDNAAKEALQQWKFVPAKRNNQSISAYVTVPISFKLD